MGSPHARKPSPGRRERWGVVVFALVLVGLLAAEVAVDFHPVKLSALFLVLFWVPLLVLHEAGHALVAAACGWRVRRVVIGFGRTLWRLRLANTPVEVRMVPLEGFTRIAPRDARAPRLKNFLIYAAGSGAELVVLGVLVLLVGPAQMLTRTESVPVIAAQAAAVAVVMGLFFNLVPHTAESESGRSPNDGLGMLASLLMPREAIARQVAEAAAAKDEEA